MTIPPFAPPSGSQPPTDPQRAPLEGDEAALAASLRALPASAPSAELDARILAMAQSALKEAQRPTRTASPARHGGRKPSLLWWMGTAAGAVMAAGIGWQLGGFGDPGTPAGRAHGAAEARPAAAKTSDELEILMIPRSASDAAPAPPAAMAPRSDPVPAAEPAASVERESRRRELSAADSSEPPTSPRELAPEPAAPDRAVVARPSPALAAPASAANADGERAQPLLERIEVTGSRLQRGVEFPPVAQDFRLAPEDWLQRVRDRRDSGDLDSARRSVREFVRAHPQRVVPKDLRLLLNEPQ